MNDRAGDDMRKIGHEQPIVPKRLLARTATRMDVGEIGYLGERIKGNAHGQRYMRVRQTRPERGVQDRDQKAGVFEIAKHEQINGHPANQGRSREENAVFLKLAQSQANVEIEQNRARQQGDLPKPVIGAKNQRGR